MKSKKVKIASFHACRVHAISSNYCTKAFGSARTRWGSLQLSPVPLNGLTEREGKRRAEREREGREARKGKGRDEERKGRGEREKEGRYPLLSDFLATPCDVRTDVKADEMATVTDTATIRRNVE